MKVCIAFRNGYILEKITHQVDELRSVEFILKAPGGFLIEHEATVYIVIEYTLILWFYSPSLLMLFQQGYLHLSSNCKEQPSPVSKTLNSLLPDHSQSLSWKKEGLPEGLVVFLFLSSRCSQSLSWIKSGKQNPSHLDHILLLPSCKVQKKLWPHTEASKRNWAGLEHALG